MRALTWSFLILFSDRGAAAQNRVSASQTRDANKTTYRNSTHRELTDLIWFAGKNLGLKLDEVFSLQVVEHRGI